MTLVKFIVFCLLYAGLVFGYAVNEKISESEKKELVELVNILSDEVEQLKLVNAQLRQQLISKARKHVTPIGFWAIKTERQNLTNAIQVTFDIIETNVGDAFGASTFICPVSGVYFFQFNLNNAGGNRGQAAAVEMIVDTEAVVRGVSGVRGPDRINQAVSGGALTYCGAGSKVYLHSDRDNNFIGEDGQRSSTFSGFLVFEN